MVAQGQTMETGVPNLDPLLGGGIPVYSLNIIAGPPGTGKTILAQQVLFHCIQANASAKVLYLTTLSEPTVKVVRYMQRFSFFDPDVFGERVIYQDIGRAVRERPLNELADHIIRLVETHEPGVLVIDSFKAIRDLATDAASFRRLCYDLSVRLASARCTAFLVGEYEEDDIGDSPEFAVADGIIRLDTVRELGEDRRVIHIRKMRGQAVDMTPFTFTITLGGIRVLRPLSALNGSLPPVPDETRGEQTGSGVSGLDGLLRGGIPRGNSIVVSGVTGTGKTTFALQFLVHGAEQGEKGLLFSFEESVSELRQSAQSFGWDVEALEREGLLRFVFIPPNEIRLEECMDRIAQEFSGFQPDRFVMDSHTVFLHRVQDPAVLREKTFQLDALLRQSRAVGLFISHSPNSEPSVLSRLGVAETVADGLFVFSTEMDGLRRKRYVEVFKMRGVDHVHGRHRMEITAQGIDVYYSPAIDITYTEPAPPLLFSPVQGLIGSNLPYGSAWLVRGEAGVGKSTLAYQFAVEGLRRKEAVLFIAADAPDVYVRKAMQGLGFLTDPYLESGQFVIMDAFNARRAQLDLRDPDAFLFAVSRQARRMPKPLRIVFDSLTPLALGYTPSEFVEVVHNLNRQVGMHRPDVALFETFLRQTLAGSEAFSLLNAFDVVVDLYVANVGELNLAGNTGYKALRVQKTRGASADTRPYPYAITPGEGIVVQKEYYQRLMGTEVP